MHTKSDEPSRNAGVWIDHRRAQIVGLGGKEDDVRTIYADGEKHPHRAGDSPLKGPHDAHRVPADDRRQRALTGELNAYYDVVIAALRDYGRVLIFGPGEAKGELHARLLKSKLADRVAAVEAADKLTDPQIRARVHAYFGEPAPRLHGPH